MTSPAAPRAERVFHAPTLGPQSASTSSTSCPSTRSASNSKTRTSRATRAISRAVVRKPDVYVFDDSFSALDFVTDAKLRAALKAETAEATVFVVAQRISTVINADRIVVLDNGRVAGIGTHRELLARNEVYREIVASQVSLEEVA